MHVDIAGTYREHGKTCVLLLEIRYSEKPFAKISETLKAETVMNLLKTSMMIGGAPTTIKPTLLAT